MPGLSSAVHSVSPPIIDIPPAEVESALVSHPAVLEAAVVGEDDRDGLIKPVAYVVLKPATVPSPGAIRADRGRRPATTGAPRVTLPVGPALLPSGLG
jgi:acyl-CoA synthetase (AMP-forming)/AMP-acid ligase II